MTYETASQLRRGWTTGACATAAVKAGLQILWDGHVPDDVSITLPKGETPVFSLADMTRGDGWVEVGIEKDAGDDPDVTHGAIIKARVCASQGGVVFRAGVGVGVVTKAGLPIGVGEPAINPVPRAMMDEVVAEMASEYGQMPNVEITISVPNGAKLAEKTWNPRLGIKGGLSILGTTGIVRPFSCAAWIASLHRGIDVARAEGLTHVSGCTGATSERVVQDLLGLPDQAMLDMGDFAGGLLKYLARHPVDRVTIGGGIGKMSKLAQGARDLHSKRSQVDFSALNEWVAQDISGVNTALEAVSIAPQLAERVAQEALLQVKMLLKDAPVIPSIVIIDRAGNILAKAGL
ncbi:cobalt-precorrin-5B (C(1))-methyltransferase [uncultured Litoreibacter sp.]|uniref:cobalt-precorrin-5B (C(1))-methyltransferase n=1 Tax=uncultured Litoreibacter sp. TaxID=1392394 RepID=UPI00262C1276|nr:cobalt-precorrin-5B (C(1))-methyltransferase [uncultured Litoreibacter sp.]